MAIGLTVFWYLDMDMKYFDLFLRHHTYKIGEAIYLRQTGIGGACTILFAIVGLLVFLVYLFNYLDNNIEEFKS